MRTDALDVPSVKDPRPSSHLKRPDHRQITGGTSQADADQKVMSSAHVSAQIGELLSIAAPTWRVPFSP